MPEPCLLPPASQSRQHPLPRFIDIDNIVITVSQHDAVFNILDDLFLRPGIQGYFLIPEQREIADEHRRQISECGKAGDGDL
ncbi:hypothetical protein D3C73_968020 [compost metagenome]